MSYNKEQWARRQQGLCVKCGAKVDRPDYYAKCEDCRISFAEYMRERRALRNALAEKAGQAKLDSERAIAAGHLKLQIEKCSSCGWKKIEDNVLFCPFMAGVCAKGAYLR